MAGLDEQFRPYAAPSNVTSVINRARTRNLPETINNDFLRIAGVPEQAYSRVLQALRFLGLIHEDGRPSDIFDALAGASDSQYRELLEKVVRDAYRSEFNVVDPGQDPQPKIIDAFQPYKPRSQINRMAMLFMSLCREAGIPVLDVPRDRKMKEAQPRRTRVAVRREAKSINTTDRRARERTIVESPAGTLLFGLTEEDVGALEEDEFQEVWSAVGKVARARARAKIQAREKEASREADVKEREDKEESTEN